MMPVLAARQFVPEGSPFAIRREHHDPRHCPPWHCHEFVELVFVESGHGWHVFAEGRYRMGPGMVFVIHPGEPHRFDFEAGESVTIINCLLLPDLLPDALVSPGVADDVLDYAEIPTAEEGFRRTVSLDGAVEAYVRGLLPYMLTEWAEDTATARGLLRMQILELLVIIAKEYRKRWGDGGEAAHRSPRALGRRIRAFLELHAHEKVSLDALSVEFHLSRRQLERIVRKETGLSVTANIHEIRIARAARILSGGRSTVGEVAAQVGYEDPAFFSRLFARQLGVTPGQYRRERERVARGPQGGF